MCATNAFLRSLGVEIYASGQRPWPYEVKAQAVAETLRPGASVNEVAGRFSIQANQLSSWRHLAKDGDLALPAADADGHEAVFTPLVVCEAEPPPRDAADTPVTAEVRISVGDVTVHLNANTPAARIAEMVRALGALS